MKIAFIDQHFSHHGGAEKYFLGVMESALDLGHRVFVVHARKAGRPIPRHEIPTYQIPSLEEVAPFDRDGEARVRTRLREVLNAEKPDVIYLQNVRNPGTVEECLGQARTFRYIHDPSLVCFRHWKLLPDMETLCRDPVGSACARNGCFGLYPYPAQDSLEMKRREIEVHRRLSGLVVASRYVRDLLEQNGIDPGLIHLRPYPLTVTPLPLDEIRQRKRTGVFEILFIGHLHPIKGLQHLLRALGQVRGRWRLTVVGSGSSDHEREFRAIARQQGIRWRVRFLGKAHPTKLPRLYGAADLLVVPSHWPEPYGMVGPEAMAHGVPVVAFDTGGVGEWCLDGETGILVPRADTRALAGVLSGAVEGRIDFTPLVARAHEWATRSRLESHTRELISLFQSA